MTSSTPNEDLAEEIDAINAIYDPSTLTPTSSSSSSSSTLPIQTDLILRIPEHEHVHVPSFLLGFDESYPSTPPRVLGTASTGSRGEGKRWVQLLSDSVQRMWTPGAVCLYDVIVDVGERVEEEMKAGQEGQDVSISMDAAAAGEEEGGDNNGSIPNNTMSDACQHGLEDPPDWIFSEVVKEKKSVFVARAARVSSKSQAERYLDYLLATEKKVAAATHNITAWRIQEQKKDAAAAATSTSTTATVQDFDDDGETAAGGRLLHLMQLMDVWNVLVVVSRWFGGVKLGPDRFRLINAVARDALVKGGFDKAQAGGADGQEKAKKKGKR